MSIDPFLELLAQVRAGDPAALFQLYVEYGDPLRRAIRRRLDRSGLRQHLDSMDIVQSVMRRVVLKVAGMEVGPETHVDLMNLMVAIAHPRITDHERPFQAERRGGGDPRIDHKADPDEVASLKDGPSRALIQQELAERVKQKVTEEDGSWRAIGPMAGLGRRSRKRWTARRRQCASGCIES